MVTFKPTASIALFVVVVSLLAVVSTMTTAEAKIFDDILELFDAPSHYEEFLALAPQQAQLVDKTVEFLAFGDAAMDYYAS